MFVRIPDALWTEIDGQIAVMSVSSGKYFEVKGAGTEVWKLLEQRRATADIVRHLVSAYKVDWENCEKDVRDFLQSMLEAGLVTEDAGDCSQPSLNV